MSERILELLNQLKDELETYREEQGNKRCWVLIGIFLLKGNVRTPEIHNVWTYLSLVYTIDGDYLKVYAPPNKFREDAFCSVDGVRYEKVTWSAMGTEEECKIRYEEYLKERRGV
jgi:hypothetical protein